MQWRHSSSLWTGETPAAQRLLDLTLVMHHFVNIASVMTHAAASVMIITVNIASVGMTALHRQWTGRSYRSPQITLQKVEINDAFPSLVCSS